MAQPPSVLGQQEPQPAAAPAPAPAAAAAAAPAPAGAASPRPAAAARASRMPAPACGGWRASSTSISRKVKGTGEKGRITSGRRQGVPARPGAPAAAAGPSGGAGIPEIPAVDFSKFGAIEVKPLARIKKLSGPHLHRAWLNIPHVTHQDEADITGIEAYRKELDNAAKDKGFRVTLLAFLIKASVVGTEAVPGVQQLAVAGEGQPDPQEILQYRRGGGHAGRAGGAGGQGGRPQGHPRDQPGSGPRSRRRRATASSGPADMQGATFTISSLGGIGGTAFTPIVNAPEVAILGVVRSKMAPRVGRPGVRAAADAAAVAVLRPPGDRRRACRPLHPASVPYVGGCA